MARPDKVDSQVSGFRANLAAAWAGSANPIGVGLDVNGRVVPGAGQTGIKGILCKPDAQKAGGAVDCWKHAELVEFAGVAGTNYTANTVTGVISSAAAGAGQILIGHTVEATRLIIETD